MANVAVVAMKAKYLNGSSHTISASTRTSARVSAITVATAAQGDPNRGCVQVNGRGIPPSRAIAYTLRVARLTPASAATNAPTHTARSTITASHVPAYRDARASRAAGLVAHWSMWRTPNPMAMV